MNWCPLDDSKIENISKLIDYSGEDMGASELYRKVADIPYCMEDKVKFILQHWGWTGTVQESSAEILTLLQASGFSIPSCTMQVIQQLYGLTIPMKPRKPEHNYGYTLWFQLYDWPEESFTSEYLSVKYRDTIFPIGTLRDYNGWEQTDINSWENPNNFRGGFDDYGLYLGESGKVYSLSYAYFNPILRWAEDLMDFFAEMFGMIDPLPVTQDTVTAADVALCEQIEELTEKGIYHQGQFWKGLTEHS